MGGPLAPIPVPLAGGLCSVITRTRTIQVAATVAKQDEKGGGETADPAKNPVKSDESKLKGKNRHYGLTCYYCKKPNHIALNCRHRIAKDGEASNDAKAGSNPDANDTGSSGASNTGGEEVNPALLNVTSVEATFT